MKVAVVIHDINRRGGQERSTLEIVDGLSQQFDVHVYAASAEDLPANVKFHHVPVVLRRPLFIKDFFFRIFASLQLAFTKYDLVHATGASVFKADIFTLQFIHKRWKRERKRLTIYGLFRKLKESFQAKVDSLNEAIVVSLNPKATYIAISEQVKSDLEDLYHIRKVAKIRHGVNLTEFVPSNDQMNLRKKLNLPINRRLLLFVGAFERKGLFYLLDAAGKVFAKNSEWDLVVLGDGPIKLAREICHKNKIESRVHFFGNRKNVSEYYAACDLFILPSLYDPFGLVAIEALAAGTPIIVSKDSGSFDLLVAGKNGWGIADGTNISELENILELAFTSQSLTEMRTHARQSVESESWNSKISEYVSLYRRIASET